MDEWKELSAYIKYKKHWQERLVLQLRMNESFY